MPATEIRKQTYQMLYVIAFTSHQMASAHVHPLQLRQQMTELLLECGKHTFKGERIRLAERMEMQAFYPLRQAARKFGGADPESRAGKSGIVNIRFYYGTTWIDTQAGRYVMSAAARFAQAGALGKIPAVSWAAVFGWLAAFLVLTALVREWRIGK